MGIEEHILRVFQNSCEGILLHNEFRSRLRTIKELFVGRNYGAIFAQTELLAVYVAAYSPSRALCYGSLLASLSSVENALRSNPTSILALGGGSGAELVGIASILSNDSDANVVKMHVIDIGDYSVPIDPILSTCKSVFTSAIEYSASVMDVLSHDPADLAIKTNYIQNSDIITAFFLLNELLASSKKDFVAFVKLLVGGMKKNALLVVVDSAGSFSEIDVGVDPSKKKQTPKPSKQNYTSATPSASSNASTYMVYHLLDAINAFELLEKSDSQWYRYPTELKYPIKLNNMRYFFRVYRKK